MSSTGVEPVSIPMRAVTAIRVGLFVGCINDIFFPQVGLATVAVLERVGVQVEFPADQTCCGQAHFNSGYWDEAARLARRFVRVFEGVDAVVTPAGSCAGMVREFYPELLDPGRHLRAAPVWELCEFLVGRLGVRRWGGRYPARAAFHASCHTLRLLRAAQAAVQLLSTVEGLELLPLADPERCCGFGGTFAVKAPELSVALADEKLQAICASGADRVIVSDTSCMLHLMGRARRLGLSVPFVHVAEVLAEAHGWSRPRPALVRSADTGGTSP